MLESFLQIFNLYLVGHKSLASKGPLFTRHFMLVKYP